MTICERGICLACLGGVDMTPSVEALSGFPACRSHLILSSNMSAAATERFAAGVTLFGYTLPTAMELAVTCVFAVVLRTLAACGFGKPE